MKRFFKFLTVAVLPLFLVSCVDANKNVSLGYEIVSKSEAMGFAENIRDDQLYMTGKCQFKYKYKTSSNDAEVTSSVYEYGVHFNRMNNYWQLDSEFSGGARYSDSGWRSYDCLNTFTTFSQAISVIRDNSAWAVRYSIDRGANKIKIEIIDNQQPLSYKTRLEFDNTLYLRTSLLVQSDASSGEEHSVNSIYDYSINSDYQDWMNDRYNIYYGGDNNAVIDQEKWIPFYYDSNNHGSGTLDFNTFWGNGVIASLTANGAEYYTQDFYFVLIPRGTGTIKIRFTLANGQIFQFSFNVQSSGVIIDGSEPTISVQESIAEGLPANTKIYRTYGYVAGFENGSNPTEYGSFYFTDYAGYTCHVGFSSFYHFDEWMVYNEPYYAYNPRNDFYTYYLGNQNGMDIYARDLVAGDVLGLYYCLDDDGNISFAWIYGYNLIQRPNDRMLSGYNLASAFEHANTNGERKYIYTDIPVQIRSFYGTYNDATNYGCFVITDPGQSTQYSLYRSGVYADINQAFTFDQGTGMYTYNTARDFLTNETILATDDKGGYVRPRDLIPGDVLIMNIIVQNSVCYGVITGVVSLATRAPKQEPSILTLSLSEIYARNDFNCTQLYYTEGYVDSISGNAIYLKETPDSTVTHYVYRACLAENIFSFNQITGLYSYTFQNNFSTANQGKIKAGDKVHILCTRSIYRGTYELIAAVQSFEYFDPCESIMPNTVTLFTMVPGGTTQLEYTPTPSTCSNRAVFSSNNESVVTVSNTGLVTAVGVGSAEVTLDIDGIQCRWSISVN